MDKWQGDLAELRENLSGPALTADDPGYESEVAVFNSVVAHRPAVVVGATSAADVWTAVDFAAEHDLGVAVLHTGHGPAVPAGPDTVLITTGRMAKVDIDAGSRTARVEAGVRFGQLVDAAAAHGLAPLPGSSPGVGVVGYTLAGGASLAMGRKYGWAADHVSALEVVTADGELRRVSPHSGSDLFSALLGGKSNFGVVTAMECALFPVTRLYAGALFYAGEHGHQILEAYRRFTLTAPEEISSGVALMNMQGDSVVSVRISCVADTETGARLIEPLRRAAPLVLDTVADIPYAEFGAITADPAQPAAAIEHFGLLREMTEDTVRAVVDVVGPAADARINIVDIRHLGGAFSRPPAHPNTIGRRDAAFAVFSLTVVPPTGLIAEYADSGRELFAALTPWLDGHAHPSFLGPADATEAGTRRAYDPDTYRTLQEVKSKYDPDNRFRTNHNIAPLSPA